MRIPIELDAPTLVALTDEANSLMVSPEAVLLYHLTAGMQHRYGERTLVVSGPDLVALEGRLGGGQVATGANLVEKVEKLARIEFGGHEIRLNPAELEEIRFRAHKSGRSVAQVVEATWMKMREEFFSYAVRS